MKIFSDTRGGSYKEGSLVHMTVEEINRRLGFTPNVADDGDKVKHSWGFTVEGERGHFGIWDYKGSELSGCFSTFGPRKVFEEIFGKDKVS